MDKTEIIFKLVEKTHEKIENLDERLDKIDINIHKNTLDLEEHIKRSDLSESRLDHIEYKLTISYLLKVVSSAVLTSGAIAGAIYQIMKITGKA